MEKKYSIKNRHGIDLVFETKIPENSIGLVFIEHGLGSFKEKPHIKVIGNAFFNKGYTTVLIDATNSVGESGGKYENATMETYYEDFEDVIFYSKKESWYKTPFFTAGHSMGADSAVRFAETYPELVKGVLAFAPVISGKLNLEASMKYSQEEMKSWKETGWTSRESERRPGVVLKIPWSNIKERQEHNLLSDISKISMPVLIVVGEKDYYCPPENQKILLNALQSRKEMAIVPGAPHAFKDQNHLDKLYIAVHNWLSYTF